MERSKNLCIYVNTQNHDMNGCIDKPKFDKLDCYDRAKALEESKRLLDLLNSPISTKHRHAHESISLSTCYFCKTIMAATSNCSCKLCEEVFCARHRAELNHNCEKLSKDTANYLNAKNQFKLRLREVKMKAGR